jgi:hypothetical protein
MSRDIPQNILHLNSEWKTRKRKTEVRTERPVPGNLSWSQKGLIRLIPDAAEDDDEMSQRYSESNHGSGRGSLEYSHWVQSHAIVQLFSAYPPCVLAVGSFFILIAEIKQRVFFIQNLYCCVQKVFYFL